MATVGKNIMVCCANGAGSSLMMKMAMQKVLDKVGYKPGKIHHCALSEGKAASSHAMSSCVLRTSRICSRTRKRRERS